MSAPLAVADILVGRGVPQIENYADQFRDWHGYPFGAHSVGTGLIDSARDLLIPERDFNTDGLNVLAEGLIAVLQPGDNGRVLYPPFADPEHQERVSLKGGIARFARDTAMFDQQDTALNDRLKISTNTHVAALSTVVGGVHAVAQSILEERRENTTRQLDEIVANELENRRR